MTDRPTRSSYSILRQLVQYFPGGKTLNLTKKYKVQLHKFSLSVRSIFEAIRSALCHSPKTKQRPLPSNAGALLLSGVSKNSRAALTLFRRHAGRGAGSGSGVQSPPDRPAERHRTRHGSDPDALR